MFALRHIVIRMDDRSLGESRVPEFARNVSARAFECRFSWKKNNNHGIDVLPVLKLYACITLRVMRDVFTPLITFNMSSLTFSFVRRNQTKSDRCYVSLVSRICFADIEQLSARTVRMGEIPDSTVTTTAGVRREENGRRRILVSFVCAWNCSSNRATAIKRKTRAISRVTHLSSSPSGERRQRKLR